MPIRLGVSLLASSSRIRVLMVRAAPAGSAKNARWWVPSDQRPLLQLGRNDQRGARPPAKSGEWLLGRRLSLNEGPAVGEFTSAEIKERAHARGVAQIGVGQEPQFALDLGERGCQLRK